MSAARDSFPQGLCEAQTRARRVMPQRAQTLRCKISAYKIPYIKLDAIQSFAQNPAARPLAQRNSSGLLSTKYIDSGRVFPLSHKKYAALSPMIPEPRITVCGDVGPLNVVALPLTLAVVVSEGSLSEGIFKNSRVVEAFRHKKSRPSQHRCAPRKPYTPPRTVNPGTAGVCFPSTHH